MDPCHRAETFTVDLGTGLGMLPIPLGLMGEGRRVEAQSFASPECDVVTIVDVRHYCDAPAPPPRSPPRRGPTSTSCARVATRRSPAHELCSDRERMTSPARRVFLA